MAIGDGSKERKVHRVVRLVDFDIGDAEENLEDSKVRNKVVIFLVDLKIISRL